MYEKSWNMRELEGYFGPCTLGFFIGNTSYPTLFLHGEMGARVLASECKRRGIKLGRACDKVYAAFGTCKGHAQFTTTTTFGLSILNGGEQLVFHIPSLGSNLNSKVSGSGLGAVVWYLLLLLLLVLFTTSSSLSTSY